MHQAYPIGGTSLPPQATAQQAVATRAAVIDAMDGHVLSKGVLVARFRRN